MRCLVRCGSGVNMLKVSRENSLLPDILTHWSAPTGDTNRSGPSSHGAYSLGRH